MLGEYLKKYRLSKNLTQEEMAKLLGMRQCNYSLLENNKLRPGITMVNRIAKLLEVEPSFVRGLLW
jgi:transcriptional regulator with XRE-family HTH domain